MGGTIGVKNSSDKGTTFAFAFGCPLVKVEDQEKTEREEARTPANSPIARDARALVVDDVKLNRELLKIILRRQGFEADVAASGHEGLALAKAKAYDVIFMDLEMPEMDGFATTELIRASEPAGRRVPIIAITGLTVKGTREKCLQAGMDDYLTKPVYLPALRSALEVHLPAEKRAKASDPAQELTLSV
jgi:CheY-like chemotaxis protein